MVTKLLAARMDETLLNTLRRFCGGRGIKISHFVADAVTEKMARVVAEEAKAAETKIAQVSATPAGQVNPMSKLIR